MQTRKQSLINYVDWQGNITEPNEWGGEILNGYSLDLKQKLYDYISESYAYFSQLKNF